jgi:hypothetical protein
MFRRVWAKQRVPPMDVAARGGGSRGTLQWCYQQCDQDILELELAPSPTAGWRARVTR